ncbi:MAG TPA: hypothetical protein VGQ36_11760 [Thermoanaerobaculia bacterium]|nr:hypothetical protein [Thermoanaerobaculia bacterium]
MPDPNAVFVNVPFDLSYEPLFVTLIGSLVFLGQEPHCVLEVREKGDGRLLRIVELMRACRMSIHDLSRTGMPVRFNMPFELGLACSLKLTNPATYEIFVLDSRPYRIDKTLSDYKGRDPLVHGGSSEGMIACLLDTFVADVPDAATEFRSAARVLRKSAQLLKRQMKTSSLFRPALFRLIVAAATDIAITRGFIKP